MQFLIIARDATDADVLARRQKHRSEHLANLRRIKASGNFILGGAMMSDDGEPIGSAVIVDFPDRAALDVWLQDEIFVREKVWGRIEVQPYRVAPV